MLSSGIVAIDGTIIATAVPTVVHEIGGAAAFPWLFSVYLLVQAVSVPVYAKLADTIGRKPIMLIGIGLFLIGSVLCGFAWSMPALIAFRVVQGFGAGAVQPMAITIAGDIYTLQERAKVQGYLASVWGIASVVGPTLGGVFSQFASWRFIFFVNIPICIIAAWMIARAFHENIERKRHRVDYLGASLITVSMSLIILAVLEGGVAWAWDSLPSIGAFVLGGLMLIAFVFVEQRAAEPVLPTWVFSRRLLLSTSLVGLGVGAIVVGLSAYVPTYLEGAIGAPPLVAGLALAALTLGWPLAASVSGRFYLRIGFKNTVLVGLVFAILGSLSLAAFADDPSVAIVAVSCFVIGLGMGLIAVPSLVAAQSSVEWNQRGVVTGANLFSRSIGSAVGVAIFGAIANAVIARSVGTTSGAVVHSSADVFIAVAVAVVATVGAALSMPRTPVAGAGAPTGAVMPAVE
ncbi:MAG: putative integral rane transport protein [Glaciihabitans sp.]|jgi:EmrB/QacA subfamily drug resistance transporter|nr:putative integral rane transport protein [Glaciihabitans sp.]